MPKEPFITLIPHYYILPYIVIYILCIALLYIILLLCGIIYHYVWYYMIIYCYVWYYVIILLYFVMALYCYYYYYHLPIENPAPEQRPRWCALSRTKAELEPMLHE